MIIRMADSGATPEEVFQAVDHRWGIEYPATNKTVVNGGIVATQQPRKRATLPCFFTLRPPKQRSQRCGA